MEKSLFWDAEYADGKWDRTYSSQDFASVFAGFWSDGIINNNSNPLLVQEMNNTLSVSVSAGNAVIGGRFYELDNNLVVNIDMGAPKSRTDLVVLRMSAYTRKISVEVHKGEPGEAEPQRVWHESVKELVLAKVSIPANALTIDECAISDMRGTEVCPWCNVAFNIDSMQNRFETWFKTLKDNLEEDAAINLQNQITALQEKHDLELAEMEKEIMFSSSNVFKDGKVYLRTRLYNPEIDTDIP